MAKPLRVLFVEDSADDALLMGRELKKGGFEVTSKRVDTPSALALALESEIWDVVLCDYQMPLFNGLEVLTLVQASGRDIPFILVSGAIGEEIAVAAMKAGAHDYLLKGNLARLAPAVARELHEAEMRRLQQEAEAKMRLQLTVLQSTANAIVITDPNGAILWVNEAFTRLTGYSAAEAVGKNPRVLKSDRQDPKYYKDLWETIKAGQVWHGELVNKRKDGSNYHEEMTVTPVTDAQGAITHFIAIKQDVTGRVEAAEALRKLNEELETRVEKRTAELRKTNEELRKEMLARRRLEAEILNISEREQRRLGRDLHDDLGQQLTGVMLLSSIVSSQLKKESHPLESDVKQLVMLLQQSIVTARNLARGLAPVELNTGDLTASIENLAERFGSATGISCEVKHAPEAFRCNFNDPSVTIHLYRIVQESLNNAAKHGKASRVWIDCDFNNGLAILTIANDGAPFNPPEKKSCGMGLELMRYRADLIGASIDIRRGDKGGCVVTCSIPAKIFKHGNNIKESTTQ